MHHDSYCNVKQENFLFGPDPDISYYLEQTWDPCDRKYNFLSHSLAPMVDLPAPIQKMLLSLSCSHRNSVQNAPIESSTALVGTTFVTISVFMSSGNFWTAFGQHLDNFWTTFGQLLDNMWATFGNLLDNCWAFVWQLLDNFWTTYGQLLGNFRATTMGDKKCVNKTRLWSFLFFGDDLRVYFSYPWISSHWYQVYMDAY